jgi:hypothetical protein
MDKKRFEDLQESIIEAGKVMRGELKPNREFTFEIDSSDIKPPIETWAICIETNDELLITGKIYPVKISSDAVWVRDEEGEATLCPKEFFVPIVLPQKVKRKLANLAQAV